MPRSESDSKAFDAFSPWSRQRADQTDEPTGRYFSDEEVLRMGWKKFESAWRGHYRGAYFVYKNALRRELDRRMSQLSTADHAALQILEKTLDDVNDAANKFDFCFTGGGTRWLLTPVEVDIDRLGRLVALAPHWPAERFRPSVRLAPGPGLRHLHAVLRKHRTAPSASRAMWSNAREEYASRREELTKALIALERMRMTLPRRSVETIDAHLLKIAETV